MSTIWNVESLRQHILELRATDQLAVTEFKEQTNKRFETVNEFRAALSDSTKIMMLRTEATARFDALTAMIVALSARMDRRDGVDSGGKDNRALLFSILSVAVSAVAVVVAFFRQ